MYTLRALLSSSAFSCFIFHSLGQSTHNERDPLPARSVDVCIIGGGSAGTYAAISLLDRGKTVAIVDPAHHLGGPVKIYTDPETGTVVSYGLSAFTKTSVVQSYFNRLGVPQLEFPPGSGSLEYVDFATGKVDDTIVAPDQEELKEQLTRYLNLRQTQFPYLDGGYNLPSPIPEDLLLPFSQFADKYNLTSLMYLMNRFTNPNLILNETALYTLKMFNPRIISELMDSANAVWAGNAHQLYTNAANIIQEKNLLLGSKVDSLRRSSSGVTVTVQTPSGRQVVKAHQLLMAAPPLLENLEGWDVTRKEKSLLGKFTSYGMAIGALKSPVLTNNTAYAAIGSTTPSHIPNLPGIAFVNPSDAPGVFTFIFQSRPPLSRNESEEILIEQLQNLATDPRPNDTDVEVLALYQPAPMKLQVLPEDIRNGFYNHLNSLQGQHSTWWTGAAWDTQESASIWEFTDALVGKMVG